MCINQYIFKEEWTYYSVNKPLGIATVVVRSFYAKSKSNPP